MAKRDPLTRGFIIRPHPPSSAGEACTYQHPSASREAGNGHIVITSPKPIFHAFSPDSLAFHPPKKRQKDTSIRYFAPSHPHSTLQSHHRRHHLHASLAVMQVHSLPVSSGCQSDAVVAGSSGQAEMIGEFDWDAWFEENSWLLEAGLTG